MSREITVDKLNINDSLSSDKVKANDIIVDGTSIKNALKNIPEVFVKKVNNIEPDETGNVQLNEPQEPLPEYDYTAFEVYPTKQVIKAGDVDADTKIPYRVEIPAQTQCRFYLYARNHDLTTSDIRVEWGDETETVLKSCNYYDSTVPGAAAPDYDDDHDAYIVAGKGGKRYTIVFKHDYADKIADTEIGKKFIYKVYGSYYAIRNYSINSHQEYNLVSRAFEDDLPISKNVRRLTSICNINPRIQKIYTKSPFNLTSIFVDPEIDDYIGENDTGDAGTVFGGCQNLVYVKGAYNWKFNETKDFTTQTFFNTSNLLKCDFVLPAYAKEINATFQGCYNLEAYADDLLPEKFVHINEMTFKQPFSNCGHIRLRKGGKALKFMLETGKSLDVQQCIESRLMMNWIGSAGPRKCEYIQENSALSMRSSYSYVKDYLYIKSIDKTTVSAGKTLYLNLLKGSTLKISNDIMFISESPTSIRFGTKTSYVEYTLDEVNEVLKNIDENMTVCLSFYNPNNTNWQIYATVKYSTASAPLTAIPTFKGFPWSLKVGTSITGDFNGTSSYKIKETDY